jgi:hypothetical protein
MTPRHLGVPSSASNTISEPAVRSTQTVQESCIKSSTISRKTEPSFHLSHITTSPIECVQNDFYAYGVFGANREPILY